MKFSSIIVLFAIIASTAFAQEATTTTSPDPALVDEAVDKVVEAIDKVGSVADDVADKVGSTIDDIKEAASMSGSMDMDEAVGSESKSDDKKEKDDSAAAGSIIATSAAAVTIAVAALL